MKRMRVLGHGSFSVLEGAAPSAPDPSDPSDPPDHPIHRPHAAAPSPTRSINNSSVRSVDFVITVPGPKIALAPFFNR